MANGEWEYKIQLRAKLFTTMSEHIVHDSSRNCPAFHWRDWEKPGEVWEKSLISLPQGREPGGKISFFHNSLILSTSAQHRQWYGTSTADHACNYGTATAVVRLNIGRASAQHWLNVGAILAVSCFHNSLRRCPSFSGNEQRLSSPTFANPSQVLRKFAKKPKRSLKGF